MKALRPYLVWGVASLFTLYQFALQVSVGVYAGEIQHDLNATAASIGMLAALFSVSYALMQIPVGILLDRFSPRWLMTGSLLVCATGALLFAWTPHLMGAGLGRLLMGLGASFGFVGASFLAGRWIAPARYALFIGLTEMLGVGGAAGFDALAGYLEAHVTWRELIHAAALFGYGLTVLVWLVVRDHPPGAVPARPPEGARLVDRASTLVTSPQLWLCAVFYFLSLGALLGFAGLWNVPFQLSFGLTATQVATANSFIFLGWAIGSPVAGWLAGRLAGRRTLLLIGVAGHFLVMATIIYTPLLPMGVILLMRFSLGFFGGMNILAFPVATDAAPPSMRGTALGIINTFGFAGVTLLQTFPGMLLSSEAQPHDTGQYIWALSVYLIALVLAAVCLVFLKEKPREPQPATV